MDNIKRLIIRKESVFDVFSLSAVLMLPSLIHFLNFDLSVIEPFRLIILSSIFLRNRINSLLLCIMLPFLTNIISGHPYLIKSSLIAAELSLNVVLFGLINRRTGLVLLSISLSIIASKLFYYSLKYILLSAGVIEGSLVSTPLTYQLITFVLISILFAVTYSRKRA